MFDRKILKQRAKGTLSGSYWNIFILTLLTNLLPSLLLSILTTVAGGIFTQYSSLLLSFVMSPLLSLPLQIGVYKYIFDARNGVQGNSGSIFYAFRSNYVNVAGVLFVKTFVLMLWAILPVAILVISYIIMYTTILTDSQILVLQASATLAAAVAMIPLLIKSYNYYLVELILAENPDTTWCDAMSESKTLMYGNRLRVFVLNLSFIGWYFLGLLAFGVGVIFVAPYVCATTAELYFELAGKSQNQDNSEGV